MQSKPRIFIGSSKESEGIAKYIFENLSTSFECEIWTDNFFELNKSTYDNLVKKAIAFDYAVFIGGKDDVVIRKKTKSKKLAPRDNVYLEFGLYAGILSPSHSYFIIDESCSIASDFCGLTTLYYSSVSDIENCCIVLKNKIAEENKINRIKLLPSTSLAIGYFENFLKAIGRALFELKTINVDGHTYNVEHYPKNIKIVIPDNIDEDWQTWAELFYRRNNTKKIILESKLRKFGVLLDYKVLINEKRIQIFDVPQTIKSAFQSVDLFVGKDYIGSTKLISMAKQNEVDNFVKTLENLSQTDTYVKNTIVFDKIK